MDDLTAASTEAADLTSLGLAAAAAAVRNGDISSENYAAALLQRARAFAELNAFISIDEAAVLAAARDADRARAAGSAMPLLGVPLGVKDSYLTKGLPTSLGLDSLAQFIPQEDADAVRAIKDAGAIVFGKSNLVEMSYGLTGHNERYGQVKNPYARDRVAGGSSSGSAASVAAGVVPASLGGDTVGSIRVPASFCGAVGFKPTTGRWPRNGVAPISHTLDTTGAFARSVEDCILLDQVVTGEQAVERSDNGDGLKGARLAVAPRQFLELVDPEVEARFREMVQGLRDAGAEIVEVDLGDDFDALIQTATWGIFAHETMDAISEFLRRHDIPTTFEAIYEGLKPGLRQAWEHIVLPGCRRHLGRGLSDGAQREPPGNPAPPRQGVRHPGSAGHSATDHSVHGAFDRGAGDSPYRGAEVSFSLWRTTPCRRAAWGCRVSAFLLVCLAPGCRLALSWTPPWGATVRFWTLFSGSSASSPTDV